MCEEKLLIFRSKLVKFHLFHLTKALLCNFVKTLSAQFDKIIIFGGVVLFYKILEFLYKIKYFQYIM